MNVEAVIGGGELGKNCDAKKDCANGNVLILFLLFLV
jgi:hypothetical protein